MSGLFFDFDRLDGTLLRGVAAKYTPLPSSMTFRCHPIPHEGGGSVHPLVAVPVARKDTSGAVLGGVGVALGCLMEFVGHGRDPARALPKNSDRHEGAPRIPPAGIAVARPVRQGGARLAAAARSAAPIPKKLDSLGRFVLGWR